MMGPLNFVLGPNAAERDEINVLFALPWLTRAQLLSLTEPRIDGVQLMNWRRRGWLNLDKQLGIGDGDQLRALAAGLDRNKRLGTRRRYTGSNCLAVMSLNVISQAGLPFALSDQIIHLVLDRAGFALTAPMTRQYEAAIHVTRPPGAEEYEVSLGHPLEHKNGGREWRSVIYCDQIIGRYLRFAEAQAAEFTKARTAE